MMKIVILLVFLTFLAIAENFEEKKLTLQKKLQDMATTINYIKDHIDPTTQDVQITTVEKGDDLQIVMTLHRIK